LRAAPERAKAVSSGALQPKIEYRLKLRDGGSVRLHFKAVWIMMSLSLLASSIVAAQPAPDSAVADIDNSVKPGDDFYRYANGGWLKANTIPVGQSSYDTRAMLAAKTSQQVQDLIQNAASAHATRGSVVQKVGDYYASFLDQGSIEAKGLAPLADEMARIAAINDKTSLSAYLGTTLNSEVEGLTANADHIFGIWINQGFEDSDHNLPHIWQGGLGMRDRDHYLDSSPKAAELRNQYQAHIKAVLKLAGVADPENKAQRVLSLEIRIAQAFAPDSDAADVTKQNSTRRENIEAIQYVMSTLGMRSTTSRPATNSTSS
jgi:putative endopeptidase